MADAATLTSASLENQLLEVATRIQAKERDTAKNPNNRNYCNVTINTDAGTATVTATFPVDMVVGTSGQPTFNATEYLLD